MNADLSKLTDKTLAYVLEQLERKVAALKFSTTAIGVRLLAQYQERLDALRWKSSGGKREADRDMTSPDGSADPGALSTRARLSGSPSERRHTSPGCLLRQAVPTPEREVQFSGRVSVSLFLRRVPILCLKYVLVPTVRRWMTTMTAGDASWTSVLPSRGNVEAEIYVGSFLSACVAGPAAAFPRLWLTK
jgi:hypothetical protein